MTFNYFKNIFDKLKLTCYNFLCKFLKVATMKKYIIVITIILFCAENLILTGCYIGMQLTLQHEKNYKSITDLQNKELPQLEKIYTIVHKKINN